MKDKRMIVGAVAVIVILLAASLFVVFTNGGGTPSEVSGGELQRAALLRAFLMEPRFLILDEPTSMLDLSTQAQIWSSLIKVRKENGMGMLIITHDEPLARAVGDRKVRLVKGRSENEKEGLKEIDTVECRGRCISSGV